MSTQMLTAAGYGNALAYQNVAFQGGQAVAFLNGFAVAPTGNLGLRAVVAYGGFNFSLANRLNGQVPAVIGRQGKRLVCFPLPPLNADGGWSYGML